MLACPSLKKEKKKLEFLDVGQHLGFSAHGLVYDCVLPGSTTVPAARGALSEAGARCCPIPMGGTEGALKKMVLIHGRSSTSKDPVGVLFGPN